MQVTSLGYKSVAHYLIQTRRAPANSGNENSAEPVSSEKLLTFTEAKASCQPENTSAGDLSDFTSASVENGSNGCTGKSGILHNPDGRTGASDCIASRLRSRQSKSWRTYFHLSNDGDSGIDDSLFEAVNNLYIVVGSITLYGATSSNISRFFGLFESQRFRHLCIAMVISNENAFVLWTEFVKKAHLMYWLNILFHTIPLSCAHNVQCDQLYNMVVSCC